MRKNQHGRTRVQYPLVVVAHNIRSAHNVGSIIRTCECLGVSEIVFTGYTPYPKLPYDNRLPHIINKLSTRIAKTSLGAEKNISYRYESDIYEYISFAKQDGFMVLALEQDDNSVYLEKFALTGKSVIILGNEVEGIEKSVLNECDQVLEIEMQGET